MEFDDSGEHGNASHDAAHCANAHFEQLCGTEGAFDRKHAYSSVCKNLEDYISEAI